MTDTPGNPSGSKPTPDKSVDLAVGIGADLLEGVQDVLKGGKIRGVRIKLGTRTIREIPVEAAAFTALLIAVAAIFVSQLHVEIDKG